MRPGALRISGQVIVQPAHPSGLFSTRESAALVGVKPPTIRAWRAAGLLAAQGLDERGYPLHSAQAVRSAEQAVRENALGSACHFDPRRTRGRDRSEAA